MLTFKNLIEDKEKAIETKELFEFHHQNDVVELLNDYIELIDVICANTQLGVVFPQEAKEREE